MRLHFFAWNSANIANVITICVRHDFPHKFLRSLFSTAQSHAAPSARCDARHTLAVNRCDSNKFPSKWGYRLCVRMFGWNTAEIRFSSSFSCFPFIVSSDDITATTMMMSHPRAVFQSNDFIWQLTIGRAPYTDTSDYFPLWRNLMWRRRPSHNSKHTMKMETKQNR